MSMEILEDNAVSQLIMAGVCIGVLVGIAFVRIRMRKEEDLGGEKIKNIQLQEAINEIIQFVKQPQLKKEEEGQVETERGLDAFLQK